MNSSLADTDRRPRDIEDVISMLDVVNIRTERMERQLSRIETNTREIPSTTAILVDIKAALGMFNRSLITILMVLAIGLTGAFWMAMRAITNTNTVVEGFGAKAHIEGSK